MKRKWGKPLTIIQQFVPQEYVATCSFKCGDGMDNQTMFPIFYQAKHSSGSIRVYTLSGTSLGWWCEGCGRDFDTSKAQEVRSEKKNNKFDSGNLYGYSDGGGVHVVYAPSGLNGS